jgi:hypothetical protein
MEDKWTNEKGDSRTYTRMVRLTDEQTDGVMMRPIHGNMSKCGDRQMVRQTNDKLAEGHTNK